jgi:glycosyltransferase involved in cell wall biosynthesis
VADGFSVILLTRRSDASLKQIEQMGEVTVYRLPPVGSGQLKKWGLILTSLPMLIKLRRQYDLVFVSGFRIVGVTAVLVTKLLGKRCVLKADSQGEMSGDFFIDGLKKFGIQRTWLPFKLFLGLRNRILKQANAFTAISDDIAAEFTNARIKAEDVYMIPNSVDTSRFSPVSQDRKVALRRTLGLAQNDKIVVYTGRLVSYKGLPLLLEVWKSLRAHHSDVTLVLVGTGGLDIHNCEAELKAYVEAHRLQGSVHFTGSVQNVHEYLQAADIFAFPTENDAFPSSLVEAMTCRLPVITTPVGAIKTIVTHDKNGLMVQPGHFHQLYEALETLLHDAELAARLGQAGWHTVQENYSADMVTQKYASLFRQMKSPADAAFLADAR